LLLIVVAGWVNRQHPDVIDYLHQENRILRSQLKGKTLPLIDRDRQRLALKAKALGRKALQSLASIATPDTILRSYRQLVAAKYDGSKKRGSGRPQTAADIEKLAVTMATGNPTWGYATLSGALALVGVNSVAPR
jgi:hypothetical protein